MLDNESYQEKAFDACNVVLGLFFESLDMVIRLTLNQAGYAQSFAYFGEIRPDANPIERELKRNATIESEKAQDILSEIIHKTPGLSVEDFKQRRPAKLFWDEDANAFREAVIIKIRELRAAGQKEHGLKTAVAREFGGGLSAGGNDTSLPTFVNRLKKYGLDFDILKSQAVSPNLHRL